MKFKTVDIKGKEYVTVNERVKYFNEAYPNGSIKTQILSHDIDKGFVMMQTTVTPDIANPDRYFTGIASEVQNDTRSMVNKTSYIENCETSSIGRALGIMGIGIDTSIASAEEVRNAIAQQEFKEELKKEIPDLNQMSLEDLDCFILADYTNYESQIKDRVPLMTALKHPNYVKRIEGIINSTNYKDLKNFLEKCLEVHEEEYINETKEIDEENFNEIYTMIQGFTSIEDLKKYSKDKSEIIKDFRNDDLRVSLREEFKSKLSELKKVS